MARRVFLGRNVLKLDCNDAYTTLYLLKSFYCTLKISEFCTYLIYTSGKLCFKKS